MNNLITKNTDLQTSLPHDQIILDGSGSMNDKWKDCCAAVNTYIRTMQEAGLQSHLDFNLFHDDQHSASVYVGNLSEYSFPHIQWPGGGTPLYDAINMMGRRLRAANPARASLIIATDGEEAGSQFTTAAQAKTILDWCRAKGWQITFIGVDFNNSYQAKALGAREGENLSVQKALLSDAGRELAKKRQAYGLYGAPMHWSAEEQQQFGGYLAPPREG